MWWQWFKFRLIFFCRRLAHLERIISLKFAAKQQLINCKLQPSRKKKHICTQCTIFTHNSSTRRRTLFLGIVSSWLSSKSLENVSHFKFRVSGRYLYSHIYTVWRISVVSNAVKSGNTFKPVCFIDLIFFRQKEKYLKSDFFF